VVCWCVVGVWGGFGSFFVNWVRLVVLVWCVVWFGGWLCDCVRGWVVSDCVIIWPSVTGIESRSLGPS